MQRIVQYISQIRRSAASYQRAYTSCCRLAGITTAQDQATATQVIRLHSLSYVDQRTTTSLPTLFTLGDT